jgi:hypothetical protein
VFHTPQEPGTAFFQERQGERPLLRVLAGVDGHAEEQRVHLAATKIGWNPTGLSATTVSLKPMRFSGYITNKHEIMNSDFVIGWVLRENLNRKPSIFQLRSWGFPVSILP